MDDDRFRVAGSRFENDEPIAFAIIGKGHDIDWMTSSPNDVLWVPETLFDLTRELARIHSVKVFANVNKYAQTRVSKVKAQELSDEMAILESIAGDELLRECIAVIRAKVAQCANSGEDAELLIEGP